MRFLAILLLACLSACSPEGTVPENVLPRDKFERLIAGSLLVEARLGHERVIDAARDERTRRYYDELFTDNGTTEEQFRVTYDHYLSHPEEMKAVYEAALNILQQQADSLAR